MSKPNTTFSAIILSIFACSLSIFIAPCNAEEIKVMGSYHTTKTKGEWNAYDEDKAVVTVTYVIKTKVVGADTVFDYANSKVKFELDDDGFTTVDIPITTIDGNPLTGEIKSFQFKGNDWDANPLAGALNDGIEGTVDIVNKAANIQSGYKTADGDKVKYTFDSKDKKPDPPKVNPNTGKPISMLSSITNLGISYNSTAKTLAILNDIITATPVSVDPIIGASVYMPQYDFLNFTADGGLAIFWASSGQGPFSISNGTDTYMNGYLPVLFYDVPSNIFFNAPRNIKLSGVSQTSPYYDSSLANISSPFLDDVDLFLNPSSAWHDPAAYLSLTIRPSEDFYSTTNGFTSSAETNGSNDISVVTVPAPLPLLGVAVAIRCSRKLRSRIQRSNSSC